jgi:hypothetical protein
VLVGLIGIVAGMTPIDGVATNEILDNETVDTVVVQENTLIGSAATKTWLGTFTFVNCTNAFPVVIVADGPKVTFVPVGIPVLAKVVDVNVTFGVATLVASATVTEAGVVPLKVSCVLAAIG